MTSFSTTTQNGKYVTIIWINGPPYLSVHIRDGYADPAKPDDIREEGWAVAVHNDYNQDGKKHTFWLFTKGNVCVKGEGRTDSEALAQVRKRIAELEAS